MSEEDFERQKKYHGTLTMTSIAVCMFSMIIGVESCMYYKNKRNFEMELKSYDLNRNGIKEKYLEIDGQKYFESIDGEKLENRLSK